MLVCMVNVSNELNVRVGEKLFPNLCRKMSIPSLSLSALKNILFVWGKKYTCTVSLVINIF